ncbi:hypothetical protein M9978_22685 [Sphingomonas sp. MG17]|uniref:Methyltransferase domain-containing protein n=1 Tax=Sphingomonas tagetis TaxID=2949092 RepID=A0A9X2HWC1_9SPHN|nr:hypothetical protein [Sphingomonas tagetis]MCP3733215.1 hypothetical protein [Sphingomonas tagetis]
MAGRQLRLAGTNPAVRPAVIRLPYNAVRISLDSALGLEDRRTMGAARSWQTRLKQGLQAHWRRRRMAVFAEAIRAAPAASVIDIGGLPELWRLVPRRPKVTLLNLPGSFDQLTEEQRSGFDFIEGSIFEHAEVTVNFDIAFSNSVLEHIGPSDKQSRFAQIVSKAPAYWIQVPSPSFPIEQHCHAALWWQRGDRLREKAMRRWCIRGDEVSARFMRDTRPIYRSTLARLFPDANIASERVCGFEKSLYAFRALDAS